MDEAQSAGARAFGACDKHALECDGIEGKTQAAEAERPHVNGQKFGRVCEEPAGVQVCRNAAYLQAVVQAAWLAMLGIIH